MRYRIRVAGKVFESENTRVLLKRAVEAKRKALASTIRPSDISEPIAHPVYRSLRAY